MLRWAREHARLTPEALAGRFPRQAAWDRGESRPTLRQLEVIARAGVASTLEGCTAFPEAFGLLGLRRMSSFDRLGESLVMEFA